jgi:hypothetical protein
MRNSLFGLIEELEIDKIFKKIQNRIESKIFLSGCIIISILKIFNIITLYQFLILFMFYLCWLNCCILFNISDYDKIEKKFI